MKIVVDASVAVKWFIGQWAGEIDTDKALLLLGGIARGTQGQGSIVLLEDFRAAP